MTLISLYNPGQAQLSGVIFILFCIQLEFSVNQIPAKYFGSGWTDRNEGMMDESCLHKHAVLQRLCCIPSSEIFILIPDPIHVRYAYFSLAIFPSRIFSLRQPEVKYLKTERRRRVCNVGHLVRLLFLSDLRPFPILKHRETFNGQ